MDSVVCLHGRFVVATELDRSMCCSQVEEQRVEGQLEVRSELSASHNEGLFGNGVPETAAAACAALKRKMDALEPPKKKLCKSLRAAAQSGNDDSTDATNAKTAAVTAAGDNQQKQDAFKEQLEPLLGRDGGLIDAKHVSKFEQIMSKELRWQARVTLCVIIMRSQPACLQTLVTGTALKTLEKWLNEANECFKDTKDLRFLLQILGTLRVLPVSLELLKQGTVGQTVGRLRKHDSSEVKSTAADLVDSWKKLVDKSYPGKPARVEVKKEEGVKRARIEVSKAEGGAGHARKNSGDLSKSLDKLAAVELSSQNAIMDDELVVQSAPARKVTRLPPRKFDLNKTPSGPAPAAKPQPTGTNAASVSMDVDQVKADALDPTTEAVPEANGGLPHSTVNEEVVDTNGAALVKHDTPNHNQIGSDHVTSTDPPSQDGIAGEPAQQAVQPLENGVMLKQDSMVTDADHPEDGSANNNSATAAAASVAAPAAAPQSTQSLGGDSTAAQVPNADQTATQQPIGDVEGKPADPATGADTGAAAHTVGSGNNDSSARDVPNAAAGGSQQAAATGIPSTSAAAPTPAVAGVRSSGTAQGSAARLGSLSAPGAAASVLLSVLGSSMSGRGSTSKSAGALSAATRAMQAADNVKLEPDMMAPRKPKRKKVSWVMDEGLIRVRYFRKDDPVVNVKEDAILAMDDAAADGSGVVVPPGFEFAARREHQDERQAMMAQHQQDEKEKRDMVERLSRMLVTIPWAEPPRCQPDPSWLVAAGEDSAERSERAQHITMVPAAKYQSTYHIPASPYEPMHPQPEADPNSVPRIPLKVPGPALQPPAVGAAPQLQLGQPPALPVAAGGQLPQVIQVAGGQLAPPGVSFQNIQGQQVAVVTGGSLPSIFHQLPVLSGLPPNHPSMQQQHTAGSVQQGLPPQPGAMAMLSPNSAADANRPGSLFSDGPAGQGGDMGGMGGDAYRRGEYHPRGPGRERSGPPRGGGSGRRGRREEDGRFGDKGHETRVCAFFTSPQGCRNGEHCRFLHIRDEEREGSGPARIRSSHFRRDDRESEWEHSGSRGGRSNSRGWR